MIINLCDFYVLGQVSSYDDVDFCKNELRFMPLTIFHLCPFVSYTIADDENDKKTIFISFVKKLEQKIVIPLTQVLKH